MVSWHQLKNSLGDGPQDRNLGFTSLHPGYNDID